MRFILLRASPAEALAATAEAGATVLRPGETLRWSELPPHTCFVIPLLEVAGVAVASAAVEVMQPMAASGGG